MCHWRQLFLTCLSVCAYVHTCATDHCLTSLLSTSSFSCGFFIVKVFNYFVFDYDAFRLVLVVEYHVLLWQIIFSEVHWLLSGDPWANWPARDCSEDTVTVVWDIGDYAQRPDVDDSECQVLQQAWLTYIQGVIFIKILYEVEGMLWLILFVE